MALYNLFYLKDSGGGNSVLQLYKNRKKKANDQSQKSKVLRISDSIDLDSLICDDLNNQFVTPFG